jgi:hypothetical protein
MTFMSIKEEALRVTPVSQGITKLRGAVLVSGKQDFKGARNQAIEDRIHEKNTRR